ncbi:hypothetical protein B0X71_18305 [Planococcus lenghuensis]|uniref:Uncharacterized protein n=2 Tax=Planococcus lenghuensis TaxID=2213202 RepID=A0A1Q2L352_9BACL|nr:hypothetical protein B0X71_18305 [Planococcus lenghuensis]
MGIMEYAGLQFILLLPLVFAVSNKKYIAAFVFLIGFIRGNYIFINPTAEDNLHRSYFEFLYMLATITASYVIGLVAQFLYSHSIKKTA